MLNTLIITGLYGIVYISVGYLCFSTWILISPPKKGRFEWSGNSREASSGWYVPAVLNTKSPFTNNWPRGLSVRKVLVISTLLWPFILLVVGVKNLKKLLILIKKKLTIKPIGNFVLHPLDMIINRHLPKEEDKSDSLKKFNLSVDPDHQEALEEIERYLQETQ